MVRGSVLFHFLSQSEDSVGEADPSELLDNLPTYFGGVYMYHILIRSPTHNCVAHSSKDSARTFVSLMFNTSRHLFVKSC